MGNVLLLLGPTVWFSLLFILFFGSQGIDREGSLSKKGIRNLWVSAIERLAPDEASRLCGIAVLSYLGSHFFVHAIIGFPADWDLFSAVGIPIGLYFYYRLRFFGQTSDACAKRLSFLLPLLFVSSLIFSLSWVFRLHQTAPLDQTNLKLSRQISEDTLRRVRASRLWKQLQSDEKRTVYTELQLFFTESRLKMDYLNKNNKIPEKQRQQILLALKQEEKQLPKLLSLPKQQFRTELQRLYVRLTPIHTQIQDAWRSL